MALTTSPAGIALIKKYEGCRLRTYRDMVGVPTIGYGNTGPDIIMGLVWTQREADDALAKRLAREFEPAVNALCVGAPTTQGQFDALVSLAYNVGTGAEKRSSVIALHCARKYDEAADAFMLYDHAGGHEVEALATRRAEEGQLYLDASPTEPAPVPSVENAPVPASVSLQPPAFSLYALLAKRL